MNNSFEKQVLSQLSIINIKISSLEDIQNKVSQIDDIQRKVSLIDDIQNKVSQIDDIQCKVSLIDDMNDRLQRLEKITLRMETKYDDKIRVLFDGFDMLENQILELRKEFKSFRKELDNHSIRIAFLEENSAS